MSLEDYKRKRTFKKTPEPAGRKHRREKGSGDPIFVVQLHHASHRHYDFRLEMDGVLKSWAVPKGPSFDPAIKRMAVEVEDHPLDYATFEGEIPHDQYGGGHVAVFDTGLWNVVDGGDGLAQLKKGHIKFELHGQRLKGQWHLVRTGKPGTKAQWLLFKSDDAWAGPREADDLLDGVTPATPTDTLRARRPGAKARQGALQGAVKTKLGTAPPLPMLTRSADLPPAGPEWIHEIKWDGYRILVRILGGEVTLWSRNGLEWTDRMPEVRDALATLGSREAVLDGEVIAGRGTRADFNTLQTALKHGTSDALSYIAFDLLHLDGYDMRAMPLVDRKAALKQVIDASPGFVGYSIEAKSTASKAFKLAIAAGFEGIISKRKNSAYVAGRSDDWLKIKAVESDEFAVVGFTPAKGSRTGIGALLLATPDATHGWRYCGRVGSGFDNEALRSLAQTFKGRGRPTPTVRMPQHDTDLSKALWFKPQEVVEVFVRGFGGNGLLRQASFKGLRPDKTADDLIAPSAEAPSAVVLSSPDKILFPDGKITKQQVWNYYQTMMRWLLPEIAGRPLSLVRCPTGINGSCFFQKHADEKMARVRDGAATTRNGLDADTLVVKDAEGVRLLVQYNALEFHPWGAHVDAPDAADLLVFDLDPDAAVAWVDVVRAARDVRRYMQKAGLESFVRTSGGKGLHVVVPLSPPVPWARAKPFAEAFAKTMAALEPDRFTASAGKALRKGRIFIDWLRNGRGATSVASFSLRARPGAPVAMPLKWSELARISSGDAFNLNNAPAHVKRWKAHPWGDYTALNQSLPD